MKTFCIFALLIAGISALPHASKFAQIDLKNERLVTDAIASAIQDASQAIKDAGLDPLHIDSLSGSYALPVPVLFSAEGLVEEFLLTGLSEIVINSMSFSILTYRLTFDISLPRIEATLDKAELDIVLFGSDFATSASGNFAIVDTRISGNVRVSVGIISGISIRSIDLNFSLGGIESALNVVVLNQDISSPLNVFLGTTIPNTLNAYSSEINELIEIVALDIINQFL